MTGASTTTPASASRDAARPLLSGSNRLAADSIEMPSRYYSTQVKKTEGRSNLPAEAEDNPHHVVKGGKVVGFRNPCPSFADIQVFKGLLL